MPVLLLRPLALTLGRSCVRQLHQSAARLSATPDWQQLIGGREVVDRKRKAFEEKYLAAVENKARLAGLTVEQLKAKAADDDAALKVAAAAKLVRAPVADGPVAAGSGGEAVDGQVVRPPPSAGKPAQADGQRSSSPVKPLEDIMDLSKAATLSTAAISQLWTTYHQAKGFLCAAIPTETYERMAGVAKKYPMFVLPLARDIVGEEKPEGSAGAVEMHLLEWAFLPSPATVLEPVPSPSTVLFTPLAEYQSRQSFAQPYLILTHYTDLARSHGIVLMRGEVSDNVALSAVDAQVLSVRLQLFYNHKGVGGDREVARRELLECFHERPHEFDIERLVKTAWELD